MERRIAHGPLALSLDDSGGEGPVIVGLHGLTASRRYVLMGSRALERDGYRVVLYDARGHGRSSAAPDGDYSYAALAGDLAMVLDGLGVERALLIGASMGAHTAVRFVLEDPDRVAGLVVVTPAYDPASFPAGLARWDALSIGLRQGGIDGFLAAYHLEQVAAPWRDAVARVIPQRLAAHERPLAVADALAAVPRSRPFDSYAELAELTMPVLVVASRDEPDPEHPLATAERYAASIPTSELIVEEAGRSPLAWQGGQLSRAVSGFAGRIPSW